MKKEILEITDKLKLNEITSTEAQKQLLCLFGVMCSVCGSRNISNKRTLNYTGGPEEGEEVPAWMEFAHVSYGYDLIEYECECGHKWSVKD
jgi:hypothetical protein